MDNNKEGNPGENIIPFPFTKKAQKPDKPEITGQTSIDDLANQRQIINEFLKGVPRREGKSEPAILNLRRFHQSDNQSRHPDKTTNAPRTPYDQDVANFRLFIQQEQLSRDEEMPPQAIIQERLNELGTTAISGPERARVWDHLASAWDALTHDSYPIGSIWERRAGFRLYRRYQSTQKPTIELAHSDTLLLGALAEAAGSPLERGIAVIEIPENLRNYEQWSVSQEYLQRAMEPHRK